MDLLVYADATARSLMNREIGVPVIAAVKTRGLGEAVRTLNETLATRRRDALINLGVFGSQEDLDHLLSYVPHHNRTLNEKPLVDLFKPHEGTYFMLDPLR
jgi:hypothetical protein